MSKFQQGLLGSVMYLFASLACPIGGYCFKKWNSKTVLIVSLMINTFANACFACTPEKWTWTLLAARSLVGWSQAFMMVWTPTWIDAFAPSDKLSRWYSYLQASVPAGVMVGYVMGYVSLWWGSTFSIGDFISFGPWRMPFLLQFVIFVPLIAGYVFCRTVFALKDILLTLNLSSYIHE
jgi:predicted MFS family arabinose efflux permease